jgi:hypothetical protein
MFENGLIRVADLYIDSDLGMKGRVYGVSIWRRTIVSLAITHRTLWAARFFLFLVNAMMAVIVEGTAIATGVDKRNTKSVAKLLCCAVSVLITRYEKEQSISSCVSF